MTSAKGVEFIVERVKNIQNILNAPIPQEIVPLLQQILVAMKELLNSQLPIEMHFDDSIPEQYTSAQANTPVNVWTETKKVLAFVFQNKGTSDISIGGRNIQAITVPTGSTPLFFFPQNGDIIDLHEAWVQSSGTKQAYVILAFD